MDGAAVSTVSVAETFLRALKRRGIEYVFANAGTDFAPIIEGLAKLAKEPGATPRFLTIPHENLAVAMAHGYYLASGKTPGVMVHVTVGTGNTVCAVMNAYRDNVPLLLMAGRTPHTQAGHIASRSAPIHWGQENFDQDGMVREYTKWAYELRAGQAAEEIVGRALDVALSEPRGPVYLTLPREVLADIAPASLAAAATTGEVSRPQPSSAHLETAARWIAAAARPLIVTTHIGRNIEAAAALAEFSASFAIPVAEPGATAVNLPASHSMYTGQAGTALLPESDLIIVIDCEVPWYPRTTSLRPGTKVVHLGIDPLYTRYPVRSFQADLVVPGDGLAALRILNAAVAAEKTVATSVSRRRETVAAFKAKLAAARMAALETARTATPIRYDYVGACVRAALPQDAIVVTELGVSAEQFGLDAPGSLIGVGIGGGLGFGLGASLGAKLAAPHKTVVATIGDGSYMFGNPTPFHFVARALGLPTLTIVCNNGRWHAVDAATRVVYPDGEAAASAEMPLVELAPSPEYAKVAEASDAFARRVDDPADLPRALNAALEAVAGGRQALLDVRMEHGRR
jgi:acetolactate synthase-1/2/3 large subunit